MFESRQRIDKVAIVGENSFIGRSFKKLSRHPSAKFVSNLEGYRDVLYCIGGFGDGFGTKSMSNLLFSNVIEPVKFLEEHKEKRIIFNFLSSYFVYGDSNRPYQESSALNPVSFYGRSKAFSEKNIISFCENYQIPFRIFRVCNVLGVDDNKISTSRNSIQYLIKQIVNNQNVEVLNAQTFIRDFIFIEDLIGVLDLVLDRVEESTNSVYNVGNGVPIKVVELLVLIKEMAGSKSRIKVLNSSLIKEVSEAYNDIYKISQLGYTSTSILEDSRLRLFLSKQ